MAKKSKQVQSDRRKRARGERQAKGRAVRYPPDDGVGAFPLGLDGQPIPGDTPGQAESQAAFDQFNAGRSKCPWWFEYLELRAEGWDWRKAALIAWMASPADRRWPRTQQELATQVLGLQSDRVLRRWREDDPAIDDRVAELQVEPLFAHRRDVIAALIDVAKRKTPKAHQDRKLFLEMSGDYKSRQAIEQSGPDGGPIEHLVKRADELSDDELAAIIGHSHSAGSGSGATETPPGT